GGELVVGVVDLALLGAVVDAELHSGRADHALVRQPEARLGVAGVDVKALGLGLVPLAIDVGVRFLGLHALVLEARVVQVQLRGAAGHVEPVLGADAPVLLVDGGEAGHVGGDHLAVVVLLLEGHLGDLAVGLDVETVDAEATGLADIDGIGDVARVVAAVLHFLLVLPADQLGHRRVRVAVRALGLAAVAVLHVDAAQQAPAQGLATRDRAEGRVDLAVVPAVHAQAQVAAIELVGIAQDDVDRAGDRVARTVGAVAAQDLDAVDHLRRDAVHPERAVVTGAGHLLAVDQHLGVAAAQATQL